MGYRVHEIFSTLQGEGFWTGRAAVFCRFSGCNLWTGREEDRVSAICRFCDTEFRGTDGPGGGRFADADALADAVARQWTATTGRRLVVCTGGEPLLQLDTPLIDALHARGFEIALETNGSLNAPAGIDHICVSPKAGAPLVQREGQELKLVFPQEGLAPDDVIGLDFEHFYLQPKDGPDRVAATQAAIAYCQQDPRWRLSLQTHKVLGIP